MGPIDYTSTFANVPSPLDSFTEGLKGGAAVQQIQMQQNQAQLAAQRQMEMRDALTKASQNPTTQSIAELSIKYPELADHFKKSFDMLDPGEKQTKLTQASQIYSALDSGNPEIAKNLLNSQATAYRNSGNEKEAKASETWAQLVSDDPTQARFMGGKYLSSALGPAEFVKAFPALGGEQRANDQAPADLAKKNADAVKAQADAKVAVGTVPALIQKPVEENLSAQAKRRIDDLNVQIGQADSETKRGQLVLERDKFIAEQGKTNQSSGAATQDAMDSANALLDQIKGVSNHPGLSAGTGTGSGIRAYFNSTDANDFQKAVAGLKAPVFLNELGKLKAAGITLGAVTEAEGKKLEQRIANLDTDQSTPAFKNQLGVLLKDTEKFISKIQASGKLPTTGGAFVLNHPTLGKVTEGDINRLLTKYPGSTREQVIQYLTTPKAGASGSY